MKNIKEILSLLDPGAIIEIIANGVEAEKLSLQAVVSCKDSLSIKNRMADAKLFSLAISKDLDVNQCFAINMESIVSVVTNGIEMEKRNLEAYETLGNQSDCEKLEERIREARLLRDVIHADILNL